MMSAVPAMTDSIDAALHARRLYLQAVVIDWDSGEVLLPYALDGFELRERFVFGSLATLSGERRRAFVAGVELLQQVAGVSYFKAACPAEIVHAPMSPARRQWLNTVYRHGLGEFAVQNGLDLSEHPFFTEETDTCPEPARPELRRSALLAQGGGKDSLLAASLLSRAGLPWQPAMVGQSAFIAELAEQLGPPLRQVQRYLDPRLLALNKAGALNGHVPVTAINSVALVCAALADGLSDVVFANERSAEQGNAQRMGAIEVNHQWSKSLAFERGLAQLLRDEVATQLRYFSLLRSLSEMAIVREFADEGRWLEQFSSCNRNFHLDGRRVSHRWCGQCPKCHFVFLALASCRPPAELERIFGADLLADPDQADGFRALVGQGADKPFECVGTLEESRAAFRLLAAAPEWSSYRLVKEVNAVITAPADVASALAIIDERGPDRVPQDYRDALAAA